MPKDKKKVTTVNNHQAVYLIVSALTDCKPKTMEKVLNLIWESGDFPYTDGYEGPFKVDINFLIEF